jgi:hypothetical protein
MDANKQDHYSFSDGEVEVWLEQEAIHMRAIDKFGDPVELTSASALKLAETLKQLATEIDKFK